MENHLSIEESLRFGWEKTRAHSALIFQVMLTLFALQIVQEIVKRVLAHTLEGVVALAVLMLLNIVLSIGYTVIALRIARGHHVSYQDLLPPFKVCVAYLLASALSGIVIAAPLLVAVLVCLVAYVLLPSAAAMVIAALALAAGVITASYFMLRYVFVKLAILEDSDVVKSLRTSAHLTEGRKLWIIGFILSMILLNILGAMLLLVGLLLTIPVSLIASAHVYVKLHTHHTSSN